MSQGNLVYSRCGREFGVTARMDSAVAFPWSRAAWAPLVFVPCFLPFHGPGGRRDVYRIALVVEPWRAAVFSCPHFAFVGVACFDKRVFSVCVLRLAQSSAKRWKRKNRCFILFLGLRSLLAFWAELCTASPSSVRGCVFAGSICWCAVRDLRQDGEGEGEGRVGKGGWCGVECVEGGSWGGGRR